MIFLSGRGAVVMADNGLLVHSVEGELWFVPEGEDLELVVRAEELGFEERSEINDQLVDDRVRDREHGEPSEEQPDGDAEECPEQ